MAENKVVTHPRSLEQKALEIKMRDTLDNLSELYTGLSLDDFNGCMEIISIESCKVFTLNKPTLIAAPEQTTPNTLKLYNIESKRPKKYNP